jgi:hypothetical protein
MSNNMPPLPEMECLGGGENFSVYGHTNETLMAYAAQCVAAQRKERAFAEHSSSQRCQPERFSTGADGRLINDDDFIYDAQLEVCGDFPDDEVRRSFSQAICDVLNRASKETE